ncbi:MAG TPA: LptF/LptG family permease [Gemmatimonadaceae bacterium]|nr:LptF/LptG family permease [Gemmatimonadaceae bacterium]
MSWARTYRLALRLLPTSLREKHGAAMEALFVRELERARARGRLHGARAGATGVWDVLRRSTYESVRRRPNAASDGSAHAPQPAGIQFGGTMTTRRAARRLLRRHATSFGTAFLALTAALLANYGVRQVLMLSARGASVGTLVEALLLAVPFTAVMTIPMSVFIAVLYEFTRLGADGALDAARRERAAVRRLVGPVLAAAGGFAVLALALTTEIVPRTNARLSAVLAGHATPKSDRAMTVGELRAAVRDVPFGPEEIVLRRAAAYEVEIQKKFALPAACVVMALVGVAIAMRVPRGRSGLVVVASCAVFGGYYALLVTGETLADRLTVSPLVGMWGANALLLVVALLAAWRRRAPLAPAREWA